MLRLTIGICARNRAHSLWLPLAVAFLLLAPAASAVTIDWVTVRDPGNEADSATNTDDCGLTRDQPCGAVDEPYRIGRYEVTNAQYTEFLNAVDPTGANPLGLYNTNMGSDTHGGIDFDSGKDDGFKYVWKSDMDAKPVNFVSWYDTVSFANWMHNGEGSGDTETGAYTITPEGILNNSITRNKDVATIFLPSQDEWYKAAYYDAVSASYNPYPFADGFNGAVCEGPAGTTTHSANCNNSVGKLTDVGAYTNSASDYGTFDQGGNVFEWNEAISAGGSERGRRGGSFDQATIKLRRTDAGSDTPPNLELFWIGFRVASVIPEPSTALLLASGLAGLAVGRRRLH